MTVPLLAFNRVFLDIPNLALTNTGQSSLAGSSFLGRGRNYTNTSPGRDKSNFEIHRVNQVLMNVHISRTSMFIMTKIKIIRPHSRAKQILEH